MREHLSMRTALLVFVSGQAALFHFFVNIACHGLVLL